MRIQPSIGRDLDRSLGIMSELSADDLHVRRRRMLRYINLQLIANGLPSALDPEDEEFTEVARGLLEHLKAQSRLLANMRCPVDQRIETFLNDYFEITDPNERLSLPARTVILDRHGMAREMALPADDDTFTGDIVKSYRVRNGVLHNPRHDRRTTVGTFHICEGGLPIPGDKKSVPKHVFAALFRRAMQPPDDLLQLPFTSNRAESARCFVSLLLRPTICPEVFGFTPLKSMEVRFIAPAVLVSNLDFVESIFGNAGDPYLTINDAGLDIDHWSGHTGAVILAPHLEAVTKKSLGLPHVSEATPRQKRDGMFWVDERECYNDGQPFKITCRDERGVIVTIISDNYFGYCKKEVKTQISFAANLFGNCEEEHAGGAIAFPSFSQGEQFSFRRGRSNGRTFQDVVDDYREWIDVRPEGYGIDRTFGDLLYVPADAEADLRTQQVSWEWNGETQSVPLLPGQIYMAPSGNRLRMEKHPAAPSWRIIETGAEGTFCHKPCTVSGGGKSEISKSLVDYMHYGSIYVQDIRDDLDAVQEIFAHDYTTRWNSEFHEIPDYAAKPSRHVLDVRRSLGSVIKLLTPSRDYTSAYNDWLTSIPTHVRAIVLIIKRFYQPEWGSDWRTHFGVEIINGERGHELKYHDRKLVGTYLRAGRLTRQAWRTFKARQDFAAAQKIQTEDDISASVVVPAAQLSGTGVPMSANSLKFVTNCEYRLFQRPDDAILRGLDKQTESDLSRHSNFISNFEPLTSRQVADMARKIVDFDAFSLPMQNLLKQVADEGRGYVVCSANPRQVDGGPTRNPRYLQDRPGLENPIERYVCEMGTRLARSIPADQPVHMPVDAVLMGRRNNPPDLPNKIRGLAVYNPIHYQELPELFMDLITSLTGKSPSTTGFGSEGALTKGPFNALRPTADLNAALVSFILTGLAGFTTAAGHIGPNVQVDHDISLLVPEVWCRILPEERNPRALIEEGSLEKIDDFEHNGKPVPAGRLGYRITYKFVRRYFGRVFDNPDKIFDESILRPEQQDPEAFADGVQYIVEAQQRVAQRYLDDGSIEDACPPLKALLHIMASGSWNGKTEQDAEIRDLFTRDSLLNSEWYRERLQTKQQKDIELWQRHIRYLDEFCRDENNIEVVAEMNLTDRQRHAASQLEYVRSAEYLASLNGTLGADRLICSP